MDIYAAIRQRFSVRAYQAKPVEKEKLLRILEAARLAPSASNRQEWRFVVVTDQETRKRLSQAARNQKFVGDAPVVIACCAETDNHVMSCGQLCYPIDVAIAIDHLTLAAVAEGLGTCWIGAFSEEQAREILGIPKNVRIVELLPLGYPAAAAKPKERLPLEELVRYEKW
jgi:nitroreductase